MGLRAAFVVAVIISRFGFHSSIHHPQSSAAGSVRAIYAAQLTYATTYKQGYAAKLKWLGLPKEGSKPSPERADLIGDLLAAGTMRGYRFTFTPGPPDEKREITSYTLTAQPLTYKRTGCRIFFTDESGVRRATQEDRAATADDSPYKRE